MILDSDIITKIGVHPSKVPKSINILPCPSDLEDKGFEKLGYISFNELEPTNIFS